MQLAGQKRRLQQQQCSVASVPLAPRPGTLLVFSRSSIINLTHSFRADPWPAAPARAATLLAPECLLISDVRTQVHRRKQAIRLLSEMLNCTKVVLSAE
jgi:hypothetical protein